MTEEAPGFRTVTEFKERMTGKWMEECFGTTPELLALKKSVTERCARLMEETTELCQAEGLTQEECFQLVRDVFERPVGEPAQELGGVMICLAAYSYVADLNMDTCWLREFLAINTPAKMEKIRARQDSKTHVVR